jgi:hypothetical protein
MIEFEFINIKLSNGVDWIVAKAKIDFDSDSFTRAQKQAKSKSQHTMAANQAGAYRSPELKYNKQLMGTLAEICVQDFLISAIKDADMQSNWKVERYDDVRTDNFESSKDEYDIKTYKINNQSISYLVESRSSIVKDRTLQAAIESFHIIGAYSSIAKLGEGENDFYILPLHYYSNQFSRFLPSQYELKLLQNEISIYLVAGCTNIKLQDKGHIDNLQQGATKFKLLRANDADDSMGFKKDFISILNAR